MKDRLSKIVKSNIFNYIFNIILIISIFLLVLIIKDISPFGDKLLGKGDALVQYKPMLYDFIMGIKTGTLEAYSFNNALGNSYMFNFVYYLISPFNLIALLFKDADMMFLSVILLKMAIASFTMTFYAKKNGASNFVSTIATISYVFSGWFLAYWYNIMWLDTFILFPLLQYALDKLLKENKGLLYIFVLALIYITNFYQAFSILIYSLVYFIIYNFFYKKDKILIKMKSLLLFLGSIFIAVMLIYVYIYTLVAVKRQMGLGFSDVSEAGYVVSAIDFIKSMFYGVAKVTTEKSGPTYPNICVNIIVFIGAISFFFNKKISVRDRLFAFIGLDLLVCCVFFKEIDYVMHMFHNVIGLTFRYSYIMSFLMIVLFIKNAKYFELNKKKSFIIIGILLVILGICYKHIEFNIFVFNIVSLLICGIFTLFYSKNELFKILVLLVVIIQSIFIGTYNFIGDEGDTTLEGNKNSYTQEKIKWRVKSVTGKDYLNQNLYYNQNVLYQYTSMTYNDVLNMVPSLGCTSGPNAMNCNSEDKFINMIFNVKDEYYLERIYSVNKDILKLIMNVDNVKYSQEQVIEMMTGIKDIFDKETLIGQEEDDRITFKTDKKYYLVDYLDNGNVFNYPQTYSNFYLEKNLDISEIDIYTLNDEKLKEVYDYLSKNQINYTYFSDSLMEGEIEVGEDQLIFTSIPYDEAWHVYIDGKEVETIKVLEDALLAIDCGEGKHKIKLEYKVDYKKPLLISISTFILLLFYMVFKRFKLHIEE